MPHGVKSSKHIKVQAVAQLQALCSVLIPVVHVQLEQLSQ